jgi:putative hydrolases of HD superfamily
MTDEALGDILSFLHEAEVLKKLPRHSWLSDGRRESVAEHCWRLSLMAIVLGDEMGAKLDLNKVLKMVVIHDLGEIRAGDQVAWKKEVGDRHKAERDALIGVVERLPGKTKAEIISLWEEFEAQKTGEARFARALDKVEALIQHTEADLSTWEDEEYSANLSYAIKECESDRILKRFRELIQQEMVDKVEKGKKRP